MLADPNVQAKYIPSYETELGKKVVNSLVNKILEVNKDAL